MCVCCMKGDVIACSLDDAEEQFKGAEVCLQIISLGAQHASADYSLPGRVSWRWAGAIPSSTRQTGKLFEEVQSKLGGVISVSHGKGQHLGRGTY